MLKLKNQRIWVEATCASSGEPGNPNSIPPRIPNKARREPAEKYVLRIRSSLEEKQKKIQEYIEKGIILRNEPRIVAINAHEIDGLGPYIDQHFRLALYGIGDITCTIDRRNSGIVRIDHADEESVPKSSGARVSVQPFIGGSHKHISAVLASDVCAATQPANLGDDFALYSNLECHRSCPQPLTQVGKQWQFIEDSHRWKGVLEPA